MIWHVLKAAVGVPSSWRSPPQFAPQMETKRATAYMRKVAADAAGFPPCGTGLPPTPSAAL